MGNLLSNKSDYENNPLYIVCYAKQLQRRLLKHRRNSAIINILEKVPVACNYMYDPCSYVTDINCFNNYQACRRPLYFQLGSLRFTPGCKIVLTKQHYDNITKLERSKNDIPFSDEDNKKVLGWVNHHNYFLI